MSEKSLTKNEKIEKLIELAGNQNRYQYSALFIVAFVWCLTFFVTQSISVLEDLPIIEYTNSTGHNITEPINYTICEWEGNFTYKERPGYSIVSEFEIECNSYKTGFIGTSFTIGLMIGCFIFGFLTKIIPSKIMITASLLVYAVCLVIMAWARNYVVFCIGESFCGLAMELSTFPAMVLLEEIVGKSKRAMFSCVVAVFETIVFYIPLYYLFQQWTTVFYIVTAIILIEIVFVNIFLFESPRRYMETGDTDKILEILRGIAKFNGKLESFEAGIKTDEYQNILTTLFEEDEEDKIQKKYKNKIKWYSLVKYPSLRLSFLVFCYIFFVSYGIYEGITISMKFLTGSIFVNTLILYFFESISSLLSGWLVETSLGRKKTMVMSYFFCTLSVIMNELFSEYSTVVELLSSLVFRFFISVASTIFYTFTLETYPGPVRSLGFGINSTSGEIGVLFTTMLVELISPRVMSWVNAVLCFSNGLAILFLKETVGLPMEETIKEIEEENMITSDKDLIPLVEGTTIN